MSKVFLFLVIGSIFLLHPSRAARIELLSRSQAHSPGQGASSAVAAPEISRDGRFVLFVSKAGNLTEFGVTPESINLYMTDRQTHHTSLISVGIDGLPANDSVNAFQFSANARRILFETAASNIVPNDTNKANDVFIRDLDLNQTFLVTVNPSGEIASAGGFDASMSADGNRVVFVSASTNLAPGDTNSFADIFVRDLNANTTDLVGLWTNLNWKYADSRNPCISDDGNVVAFERAQFLTNGVFTYDFRTAKTQRADAELSGTRGSPLLSGSGRYVVVGSVDEVTVATNVLLRFDIETGAQELISSNNFRFGFGEALGISFDGKTIVYNERALLGVDLNIWRDGQPPLRVGKSTGHPFGSVDLSADGRYLTFMTAGLLFRTNLSSPVLPLNQAYLYEISAGALTLISPGNDGLGIPDTAEPQPVINSDGSFVAFVSSSQNVDGGTTANIYVFDRVAEVSELVSAGHPAAFANVEAGGSAISNGSVVSDDGRKIVYSSLAPAEGVADTNRDWDVFVLDRITGRKQLASVSSDSLSAGSSGSFRPIISGNGNVVVFVTTATNLAAGSSNLSLCVRDLAAGLSRIVGNVGRKASKVREIPPFSISGDGRLVTFASSTLALPGLATPAQGQIYLLDTAAGHVTLVSSNSAAFAYGNSEAAFPVISRDGGWIAFWTTASNLGFQNSIGSGCIAIHDVITGAKRRVAQSTPLTLRVDPMISFNGSSTHFLFRVGAGTWSFYDIAANAVIPACNNAREASFSEDLRFIALTRNTQFQNHLLLLDRVTGVETLISTNSIDGVAANGPSISPRITSDGRYVVFESRASNLVAEDGARDADIFLYDVENRGLSLLTGHSARWEGEVRRGCGRPVLSPDNRFVVFRSFASDLAPNDFNEAPDIFAVFLPAPDIDNDQLDDLWEQASFGSLDLSGEDDTDLDGLSDREEFLAGTDPHLATSTVRFSDIKIEDGTLVLRWDSIPGRAYTIQARSDLAGAVWTPAASPLIASGQSATLRLPLEAGALRSFLRVVVE